MLALYQALHPARWIAKSASNLKRSVAPASAMQDDQKRPIAPGDVLTATRSISETGHFKLTGARLNNAPLDGVWFAYAEHFEPS